MAQKRSSGTARVPEFSIIIPCLNESRTLPQCIARANRFIKASRLTAEIVIGDNGSTDGSQAIAHKLGARVVSVTRRGYGAAIFGACEAARGKYFIMGDADDSYHFDELKPFIEPLRAGYDLVMGNRFAGGIEPGAMPWKNRYIGNPVLSFIGRFLFSSKIKDFHCGMRGFSREAFGKLDLRTTGMEFASEMVIKAVLRKMKITEVPVKLYKDGRDRPPHLRPWRDGWRHLRFMLLYSPRWLFLYPGLALLFLGVLLIAALIPGVFSIGDIRLDIHSMLYASSMVMLGYQAILYSYLAKSFAIRSGLLNADSWTKRFDRVFSLELGALLGLVLLLAGLGISINEVTQWSKNNFGLLNPVVTMRPVILAVLLMILGLETILFSFFASFFSLGTRMPRPE